MTDLTGHETLRNAEFRALIAKAVGELQNEAWPKEVIAEQRPTLPHSVPPGPTPIRRNGLVWVDEWQRWVPERELQPAEDQDVTDSHGQED